jgi:hypothetical protein
LCYLPGVLCLAPPWFPYTWKRVLRTSNGHTNVAAITPDSQGGNSKYQSRCHIFRHPIVLAKISVSYKWNIFNFMKSRLNQCAVNSMQGASNNKDWRTTQNVRESWRVLQIRKRNQTRCYIYLSIIIILPLKDQRKELHKKRDHFQSYFIMI